MCSGAGIGGGIGGILGGLADAGLAVFAPELAIPLALATGAGGFLGGTAGGLASGEKLGPSLISGAESGGIGALTAGAGNVLAGGDFLGGPASSLTSLFGGSTPAAASDTAAAAGTAAAGAASDTAAAAGGAAAATPAATTLTATAPSTGTALSTAAPTAVGAGAGGGGAPLAASTGAIDNTSINPFASLSGATPTAGSGVSPTSSGSGIGGWLSKLWSGSGSGTWATDASGNPVPLGSPGVTNAGGGSDTGGISGWLGKTLTSPSTLIAGGAAALPLIMGQGKIPGLSSLQANANFLNTTGQQMADSLRTGMLPAGAQAGLDASARAAKAQVASTYASMGLSGSSMEADAMANIDQRVAAQRYQELVDATKTGLDAVGQASPLYTTIMNTQIAQDKATQDAIARLAAALAGGTGAAKAA